MANLAICENLDRGSSLAVELLNDGDLGVIPNLQLVVQDADGNVFGNVTGRSGAVAWPHETDQYSGDLPVRLLSGSYVLIARVAYSTEMQVEQQISFSIGGDPATAAPLCANPTLG